MDAITMLENQHQEVKALFEKIGKAKGEAKQPIFDQIADALAVHAAIEEKHFYPASKAARTEDLLREAVEEHLGVKRLLADLLELEPSDAQFDAKVQVLQEQVEHHVKEEEGELFPQARKVLSKDELEDLAVVMEDMAAELKSGGAPRMSVPGETASAAPIE